MIAGLRRRLLGLWLSRLRVPRDVTRFACRHYAESPALIHGRHHLSYAELGERILRMATLWRQWGVGHGSPVFCLLPDGIEQMIVRFAAAETGAMLTLLAADTADRQLAAAIAEIEPSLLVCPGEKLPAEIPGRSTRTWPLDDRAFHELAAIMPLPDPRPLDPLIPASLGFTSGTTGTPKVLAISHGAHLTSLRQVVANIDLSQRRPFGRRGRDRVVIGIPLTGAGSGVVLPSLLAGACLVIPERYDAASLLDNLRRHRATRLFTTPSLLIDLLDQTPPPALPDLRHLIYGTELMPSAKLEEALERFGPILQQGYGSAEVLPPVSLLAPADHVVPPDRRRPAPRRVLMSAGRVVPGVHVRIVDADDRDLPAGEIGEVLIKSPTVFSGYWRRPDLTATSLRAGYLVTGDTGRIDGDGYLTLLGRKADLIVKHGRTIYPRLVEEPMHDHPAVKEASLVQVGEQAVMAVSLRRAWRERPAASDLIDEFSRHLDRYLPDWQRPDRFVLFDELPRSRLGKVLRREVRAALEADAVAPLNRNRS